MALDAHHANARKLKATVNEQLQAASRPGHGGRLQSPISQNLNALAREVQESRLLAAVAPVAAAVREDRQLDRRVGEPEPRARQCDSRWRSGASSRSAMLLAGGRGGGEHAIDINGFAAHESRRLHESDSAIDGLTGNATAVLDQLGQQRGALKGVHKVLDLATTLGVSNSVTR